MADEVGDEAGGGDDDGRLERGAVAAGAAADLGEDPVAAGALQGVDLELRLLVSGGDAGITE